MFIGQSEKIVQSACLKCGYKIDGSAGIGCEGKPKAGDVSICIKCGNIAVFDDNLYVRKPTDIEQKALDSDKFIKMHQRLIIEFAEYYKTLN